MAKKKYKNIFDAIEASDVEAVKSFLPEQLEARDNKGRTPFNFACGFSNIEIVRLLFNNGAYINIYDNYQWTPLHYACWQNNIEITHFLLEKLTDTDIDIKDYVGQTPLICTCRYGLYRLSEALVKNGADPTVIDNYRKSALDYDNQIVKDKDGNEAPHRQILIQLRAEYLNKHTITESEHTAALLSDWEMEM